MKTTEIIFKVTVDENNLPHTITWTSPETGDGNECKSMMVALWDGKDNSTMRIDLWTKDMMIDEMKKFYHQNVFTLTDTYMRATGDNATGERIKALLTEIGKENGILKK
ncbi:MAG: gliding motility protein GldC [bacterium]|nr:gliding motility protein GldC [bacterium]